MVYDVNNNSKSDHTGELSPFVSESKLTLSKISPVLYIPTWYVINYSYPTGLPPLLFCVVGEPTLIITLEVFS